VDEWQESVAEIYEARGEAGLRELRGIGKKLAKEIAGYLQEEKSGRRSAGVSAASQVGGR
jgi:DNA polymerase/3'-5' exonuclease PolX